MTIEKEYTEGQTTFLSADVDHYSENKKQPSASLPVFYNPRMKLNRDISVLFLSAYLKKRPIVSMCEPLTGSGVRTLRYLNECPGDFSAKMFDANPLAVETAKRNVEKLDLSDRAEVIHGDAKLLLLTESRGKRFDFVDVDPFGTPAPYLNSAMQSLSPKGGLLAVTATDMPVLCGVYPKIALRRYGGFSIRAPFTHEIAVRLLNGLIYRIAGLNDCSIEPLAVLSTDHYVRTWVRIETNRTEANQQTNQLGTIQYCLGCMHSESIALSHTQKVESFDHKIENCKGPVKVSGPLWNGPLFSDEFLTDALKTYEKENPDNFHRRVPEILEKMTEEAEYTEYPFIDIHALCDLHGLVPPKNREIMEHLRERGFSAVRTHFKSTAIRTTASVKEMTSSILEIKER
ncbi:MAG: tRNA (guanine(10)-N(2))-dimethyltransferase [Candidatus Thorarchaeota archaeon]|jgi:tRNA (guanine26-N2/guanine27-N2)-dimethyltransferase